ncbi:hypothetical protein ACHAXN_000869 [Cyclotella atomus]
MSDIVDDEPFLINAAARPAEYSTRILDLGSDEAKLNEPARPRFKHGNNLRRRFRSRNNDEAKGDDEEKGDDLHSKPAAEESKEVEVSMPRAGSRFRSPLSLGSQPAVPTGGNKPHRLTMPMMHQSHYIRRPPDEKLKEKFNSKFREVADGVPEVHFIGEVVEGVGFSDTFVSCKWYLEWGRAWSFLEGEESTQTQYASSDDGVQVWNHPIDAHFASASIQGWPRMVMQVWELDEYGRSILAGYGFAHLPTNAGYYELEVHCWRPSGSIEDELQSFFLGTSSCLVDEEVIFSKAWEKRGKLKTVTSGIVKLHVTVLLRFFSDQKVA